MKTDAKENQAGERTQRFTQERYCDESIQCEGKTYQSSLWFDHKKDVYVWRLLSPEGKVVFTFPKYAELKAYIAEQVSRQEAR